jgi:hypothetical protein
MIQSKKRSRAVLNRQAPPTGRQAFRGIIQPLMLAGGSSTVSPQILSEQYAVATATVADTTTTKNIGVPGCEMTRDELQLCQWNPNLSFCRKRGLKATDPLCDPKDTAECPLTDTLKKVCSLPGNSTDPLMRYRDFCRLKKIDGMCVDQAKQGIDDKIRADEEQKNRCARLVWAGNFGPNKKGDIYQDFCPLTPTAQQTIDAFMKNNKTSVIQLEYYQRVPRI